MESREIESERESEKRKSLHDGEVELAERKGKIPMRLHEYSSPNANSAVSLVCRFGRKKSEPKTTTKRGERGGPKLAFSLKLLMAAIGGGGTGGGSGRGGGGERG